MRYSNLSSLAYWFCLPKFRYHNKQLRYENLLTTDFIRLRFRRFESYRYSRILFNVLYDRYSEIEKYVIYGDIAVIAARMMAMCVLSLLLLVVMLVFCPISRRRRCSN